MIYLGRLLRGGRSLFVLMSRRAKRTRSNEIGTRKRVELMGAWPGQRRGPPSTWQRRIYGGQRGDDASFGGPVWCRRNESARWCVSYWCGRWWSLAADADLCIVALLSLHRHYSADWMSISVRLIILALRRRSASSQRRQHTSRSTRLD